MKIPKLTYWVARDECGSLFLYVGCPLRHEDGWEPIKGLYYTEISRYDFPELKWEDEPAQVEIKLI